MSNLKSLLRQSITNERRKKAQRLAHEVNYNHALTADQRYALSMQLSVIMKQLGAMGVDAAAGEDEEADNE